VLEVPSGLGIVAHMCRIGALTLLLPITYYQMLPVPTQ